MAENGNGAAEGEIPVGGAPEDGTPGGGDQSQAAIQAQAGVLAQYVKDLSFENPNAPASLQNLASRKPQVDVNVNVGARKLGEEAYEVELKISAKASYDDQPAFVAELVYGALFGLRNVPEQALQPFLLVQAPVLMFPFARRIIADTARDGGFPPLLLEPIDFAALYRQQAQSQAQGDAPAAETTPPANDGGEVVPEKTN